MRNDSKAKMAFELGVTVLKLFRAQQLLDNAPKKCERTFCHST